jgi:type IV secretory pathway VirB10-like protein
MDRVELLPDGRLIVVRFVPHLALAASVLGVFAASSGTALMLPQPAEEPAVPLPEIVAEPAQQAPAAVEPAATAGPAITGAQIAALALTPARDRAAVIVAEQARTAAAEAQRARAGRENDGDRWDELSDQIQEACEDGRIRGPICRSS